MLTLIKKALYSHTLAQHQVTSPASLCLTFRGGNNGLALSQPLPLPWTSVYILSCGFCGGSWDGFILTDLLPGHLFPDVWALLSPDLSWLPGSLNPGKVTVLCFLWPSPPDYHRTLFCSSRCHLLQHSCFPHLDWVSPTLWYRGPSCCRPVLSHVTRVTDHTWAAVPGTNHQPIRTLSTLLA